MSDRGELIQGLRDLALLLETKPRVPTPTVVMTASARECSFMDAIYLAESLAPCTIEPGFVAGKRTFVRQVGPLSLRVLVDESAVGETRTVVSRGREFFVDTEIIRAAGVPTAAQQ